MQEAELIYFLIFILFTYCLVYPPAEFVTLGLTVNRIASRWLGSEEMQFIQYHRKRIILTILVHSLLPFLFLLFYYIQFNQLIEWNTDNFLQFMCWNSIISSAILLPIFAIGVVIYWLYNDWVYHPLSKTLQKYCNNNSDWRSVGITINDEFRRDNIIITKISTISSIVVTDNWIIKTTPYNVYFAHQSDTALIAIKSDTHAICEDTSDPIQFVNILIKPTRLGVQQFNIRINALDFKDLQTRITRPITVLAGVTFNRSIIERFVEAFKEEIEQNPRYHTDQVSETCFACMQTQPNIKLDKQCLDINENGDPIPNSMQCGNCYCRPMWCVTCLAKWFASKQNEYDKEMWLQQKCTCPMCRAPFCILDVCYVERN